MSETSKSIDEFYASKDKICNELTAIYNLSESALLFGNPIVAKRLDDIALHISNDIDVMTEAYKKALYARYKDANQSSQTLLELGLGLGKIIDESRKKDAQ